MGEGMVDPPEAAWEVHSYGMQKLSFPQQSSVHESMV